LRKETTGPRGKERERLRKAREIYQCPRNIPGQKPERKEGRGY